MQILHRSRNGISIIYMDGSLDWEGISQLKFFFEHSIEYLQNRIVLNLNGVEELDPECFGHLIHQIALIRDCGWNIILSILHACEQDVMSDVAVSDLILEYPSLLGETADFPLLEINLPG